MWYSATIESIDHGGWTSSRATLDNCCVWHIEYIAGHDNDINIPGDSQQNCHAMLLSAGHLQCCLHIVACRGTCRFELHDAQHVQADGPEISENNSCFRDCHVSCLIKLAETLHLLLDFRLYVHLYYDWGSNVTSMAWLLYRWRLFQRWTKLSCLAYHMCLCLIYSPWMPCCWVTEWWQLGQILLISLFPLLHESNFFVLCCVVTRNQLRGGVIQGYRPQGTDSWMQPATTSWP